MTAPRQARPAANPRRPSSPGVPARRRQSRRLAGTPWRTNAETPPYNRSHPPTPDGLAVVEEAFRTGRLSQRGASIVIALAWTVADLAGRDRPAADHVRAALALRQGHVPDTVA